MAFGTIAMHLTMVPVEAYPKDVTHPAGRALRREVDGHVFVMVPAMSAHVFAPNPRWEQFPLGWCLDWTS